MELSEQSFDIFIKEKLFRKAPPKMDRLEKSLPVYALLNIPDDRITVSNAASLSMRRLWQNKIEKSRKWTKDTGYFESGEGHEMSERVKDAMGYAEDIGDPFLCPSDLFMAGTIPLPSVEIVQLEPEKSELAKGVESAHVVQVTGRVFIFDDYKEEMIRAQNGTGAMGKYAVVGYTEVECHGIRSVNYLIIGQETEYLMGGEHYSFIGISQEQVKANNIDIDDLTTIAEQQHSGLLIDWYSIQIAMLHPIVKDRFGTVKNHKERMPKQLRKMDKSLPEVKYIRYITLDSEQIEENSYVEEKDQHGIVRKTLIWHVTGHFRYRKGKKEWVNPYFKGPARWMKQQETRSRSVVDKAVDIGDVFMQEDGNECEVTYVSDDAVTVRFDDGTEACGYIDELKEGRLTKPKKAGSREGDVHEKH